ncbi:MAG: CPBP family glutamic-type intramembrane protease [Opitutaceae bacterium]|jgi:hypothetical protein
MKPTHKPILWISLCAICALCSTYAWINFSKAIPILRIEIKMDCAAATAAAEELARAHGWSPKSAHKNATLFTTNEALCNFIELEAGGRGNLGRLLDEGGITPYRWVVRLYRENDASETSVFFKPDGKFAGFFEKLPESAPGAALGETEARAIAEKAAPGYGVGLSSYKPIESKDNRTVSGRIDHAFTYERPNKLLGAGRDLVVIRVRGDRVCGVDTSVRIPDDFFRRYESMRSANNTIQAGANIAMMLGLIAGGSIAGLVMLGRKGGLEWRRPVAISAVLGTLGFLSSLNFLPLAWFDYDTALSASDFIMQRVLGAVSSGLLLFATAVLALTAAENLSREAFPSQPQLWRVLSSKAGASREIFGRVAAGYLLSGLWFAYLVWAYSVGSSKLGWWMPSSPLSNPGILSTPAPWLAPFTNALQAGVIEESLFRAVPLAWAVILGRRFGRLWLWVSAILMLQAVVFGACHANYPNQPAWARLVELTGPALVLGGLYLSLGLLPGILIHFFYDVVLMSLPLFVSRSASAGVNSIIVLALAGLPLALVIAARLRAGRWLEFPEALRYRAWAPRIATPKLVVQKLQASPLLASTTRVLLAAGIIAAPIWLWESIATPDMPGIGIRKAEAIAAARSALEKEGVKLGPEWKVLAIAQSDSDIEWKMVWQSSGEESVKKLLGNTLACPHWSVRFVRPDMPLPDRAEEYGVNIGNDSSVIRYRHQLPEQRPGAQLAADAARSIAERELKRIYGIDASKLKAVTSTEEKHPNRKDWLFVWTDPSIVLKQGDARVWIRVRGDAFGGHGRFVFVPEDWSRADRTKGVVRDIVQGVISFVLMIVCLAAIITAVRDWMASRFNVKAFLACGAAYLLLTCAGIANGMPAAMMGFSTNEGFTLQLVRMSALQVAWALIFSSLVGLFAGQQHAESLARPNSRAGSFVWLGLAVGMIAMLAKRLIELCKPHDFPWHAGIDGANSALLALSSMGQIDRFFAATLCALCVYGYVNKQFPSPRARRTAFAVLGLLSGCAMNSDTWLAMALSGVAYAAAFPLVDALILRTHRSILVPIFFARVLTKIVWDIVVPGYSGSHLGNLVALIGCSLAAWLLFRMLQGSDETQTALKA